jgi:hypothetical protein
MFRLVLLSIIPNIKSQVYGCEYQATAILISPLIQSSGGAIPFYPAPDNAPGVCSCNVGKLFENFTAAIKQAPKACDQNLAGDIQGCNCCTWSAAFAAYVLYFIANIIFYFLLCSPHNGSKANINFWRIDSTIFAQTLILLPLNSQRPSPTSTLMKSLVHAPENMTLPTVRPNSVLLQLLATLLFQ